LIVGAIITRLIIPNFTRQWQHHQKELEVKIALTDEINKATSDINTATALMTYSAFVNKNRLWLRIQRLESFPGRDRFKNKELLFK